MCAIAPQNRNKAQPALGFPPSEILDWTMESEEREHGEGSGSVPPGHTLSSPGKERDKQLPVSHDQNGRGEVWGSSLSVAGKDT